MHKSALKYYSQPGVMTDLGAFERLVCDLPNDVSQIIKFVQGVAIHMYVAQPFYGVSCDPAQQDKESNLRKVSEILGEVVERGAIKYPLPPDKRVIGVCHHFSLLTVAILRAKGIPARVRYGFGGYFNPGFYEDHSLCEYWSESESRWILADPQFDDVWVKKLAITHNVLDVPRDAFLTAAAAWDACRNGRLDPSAFGIFNGDMRGLWFVAGNLIKDVASLNKVEMLQWDAWKGMPRPNNTMKDKKRLAFFDSLAELTALPDDNFTKLRDMYADPGLELQVPKRVFNAMRRHLEYIEEIQ